MVTIAGVSGSLRKGSLNTALLRAAKELAPKGVEINIVSIADIPLYNGDDEAANGLPGSVVAFKEALASADGVLLVTPEYNNGVPGVFKNAIDWASRPAGDIAKVFGDKPFAVIGASPGGFGTILSQNHWLPVLRTLGVRFFAGDRLMASRAHQAFDESGALTDDALRGRLSAYVEAFANFIRR
ncbi:MAG: NADPH-dependent FMN reductase [Parvularculaceae bacterium]